MKKYVLTKEQYNILVEKKQEERFLIKEIKNKINKLKKNLNESKHKNGISSILNPYYKKGKINKFVAESLINDGVNKEFLITARDKL